MGTQLGGLDSLLSTVQMPAGIPVGTLAIGRAGAVNAALLAAAILALSDDELASRLRRFREEQTEKILGAPSPSAKRRSGRGKPRPYERHHGEQIVAVALELDRAEALDRRELVVRPRLDGRQLLEGRVVQHDVGRHAVSRERSSRQWRRRSAMPLVDVCRRGST